MARASRYRLMLRFIERVYGRDGEHETCYLTRVWLTPRLPFIGQLYLHIFHRGDADPDPHDHPWSFWTMPLNTYVEEVYEGPNLEPRVNVVRAWRIHHRHFSHVHRVLGKKVEPLVHPIPSQSVYWWHHEKVVTLVWHGRKTWNWGFWVEDAEKAARLLKNSEDLGVSEETTRRYVRGNRVFVYWKDYLYKGVGSDERIQQDS